MGWKEELERVYHTPEHAIAFTGPSKILHWLKERGYNPSIEKVRQWCQNQDEYSLSRETRKPKHRFTVRVSGMGWMIDADLIDMTAYGEHNEGYLYILIVIDVFTRRVWCRPLKSKTNKEVIEAFDDIFTHSPNFSYVRTDRGKEFTGKTTETFFKERGLMHYTGDSENHANYAERAIKTLKSRLSRYIVYKQSSRWIDVLQPMVESYNHTYHRSIGMRPIDVTKENEGMLLARSMYPAVKETRREVKIKKEKMKRRWSTYRFKLDDYVRISQLKTPFDKQYNQKWTGEVFKIASRHRREQRPVYKLKDYNDEPVSGMFYQSELQKVVIDPNRLWKVEKVLRTRRRKGREEVFVKFLHWPKKFNTWIPKREIENL